MSRPLLTVFTVWIVLLAAPASAGRYCTPILPGTCINATDAGGGYANFIITFPTSVQWIAFGIGTQMQGADLMAFWVAADGTFVAADKYGTANAEPGTDAQQSLEVLPASYIDSSSVVVLHWRRKFNTADPNDLPFPTTPSSYIWAWKSGARLSSTSPSTQLGMHDTNDNLPTMNLFDAAQVLGGVPPQLTGQAAGSAAAGASSSASTDVAASGGSTDVAAVGLEDRDGRSAMLRAHGLLMALSWGLLAPASIAALRYGKKRKWRNVHTAGLLLTVLASLVAFALAVAYQSQSGRKHFPSSHTWTGLATLCAALLQVALGFVLGMNSPALRKLRVFGRPLRSVAHVWAGRIVLPVLALASCLLGASRYATLYSLDPVNLYFALPWFGLAWTIMIVAGELTLRHRAPSKAAALGLGVGGAGDGEGEGEGEGGSSVGSSGWDARSGETVKGVVEDGKDGKDGEDVKEKVLEKVENGDAGKGDKGDKAEDREDEEEAGDCCGTKKGA